MKRLILLILLSGSLATITMAQDTLPNFTLKNAGNNRIIIGWSHTYTNIKQISIQRSFDSLTAYKTILTVADPSSPQNGFVDAKATNDHMFYRLYLMFNGGVFLFTTPKKPVLDGTAYTGFPAIDKLATNDSTKIPVVTNNTNRIPGFIPSLYVYTHRDGYVKISLPENEKSKKYVLKFFDDADNLLFELKEVKERNFKIDKANFYHAGWFRFELYEDEKLFERHKFYLDKDY